MADGRALTLAAAPPNEAALLHLLRGAQGRESGLAAFAGLVRSHHRALLQLARALGAEDAEEVVQSAWVKAWQAIGSFEGRASLRTWLARIVVNETHLYRRQRRREVFLDDLAGGEEPLANDFNADGSWASPPCAWRRGEDPAALLMADELADCLQALMARMPASQRALLELRDGSELPFAAICAELQVSPVNARVLLHRARQLVFKLVDRYQETGEC